MNRRCIALFLFFFLLSPSIYGWQNEQFEIRTIDKHELSSYYYRAAVHDTTIAVIEGSTIHTYDFSDGKKLVKSNTSIDCATLEFPQIPQILIGGFHEYTFSDIAIRWPHLLVPTTEFLQIFDIGDPNLFKQIGVYKPMPDIYGVGVVRAFKNRVLYAYKSDVEWILESLDISDVRSPKGVGKLVVSNPPFDIVWDGGPYAYIYPDSTKVKDDLKIEIVNVSDPTNPFIVSSIPISDFSFIVKVESTLFVCGKIDLLSAPIPVCAYDVSSPETPALVSSKMLDTGEKSNFPSILFNVGINQWFGQNGLGSTRLGGGSSGLYRLRDGIPDLIYQMQYEPHSRLVAAVGNYLLFVYSWPQPYRPLPPQLILSELILPSSVPEFDAFK